MFIYLRLVYVNIKNKIMTEEMKQEQAVATEEKEYVFGYTVKVAADGSVDVNGIEINGETAKVEAIYEHIEELYELVKENKQAALIQKAATEAAYYAVRRALLDHEAYMKQQADAAEAPVVEE